MKKSRKKAAHRRTPAIEPPQPTTPVVTAEQVSQKIDSLFKYVPFKPAPQVLMDRLAKPDRDDRFPFNEDMHDTVELMLQADFPDRDVKYILEQVGGIDDASLIAEAAFKAGFLFGAEYGKRQNAYDDEEEGGA
jgi:hypothetical protein